MANAQKYSRKVWSVDATRLDDSIIEHERERLQRETPYRTVTRSDVLRSLLMHGAEAVRAQMEEKGAAA